MAVILPRPDLREQMIQQQQEVQRAGQLMQNDPAVLPFIASLAERLLGVFGDPTTSALPVGANITSRVTGRVLRGMPKRNEKQIQAEIDSIETDLLKKGVDITKVFPAKQPINLPGFQQEPARLTRLRRQLEVIDAEDKKEFFEVAVSKTGLPQNEANEAIRLLGFHPDKMTALFAQDVKNFGVRTTNNIEDLYNHFIIKKFPSDQDRAQRLFEFARFRFAGTADKPQLIGETMQAGGRLDKDILRKVQRVYNAVADNLGKDRIDFFPRVRVE